MGVYPKPSRIQSNSETVSILTYVRSSSFLSLFYCIFRHCIVLSLYPTSSSIRRPLMEYAFKILIDVRHLGPCDGVILRHRLIHLSLTFPSHISNISELIAHEGLWPLTLLGSMIARSERGQRPTCTSLGARPVTLLTEYGRQAQCGKDAHPSRLSAPSPPSTAFRPSRESCAPYPQYSSHGKYPRGQPHKPHHVVAIIARKLETDLKAIIRSATYFRSPH